MRAFVAAAAFCALHANAAEYAGPFFDAHLHYNV
jgi:hypothetical protein